MRSITTYRWHFQTNQHLWIRPTPRDECDSQRPSTGEVISFRTEEGRLTVVRILAQNSGFVASDSVFGVKVTIDCGPGRNIVVLMACQSRQQDFASRNFLLQEVLYTVEVRSRQTPLSTQLFQFLMREKTQSFNAMHINQENSTDVHTFKRS